MSGHTWKLIDWFKKNQGKSQTRLAINSNLGFDSNKLNEFITAIESIPELDVYTSNEAILDQAEYIRDGLVWDQWIDNVETLLASQKIRTVHVMCTVNALCLETLPRFLHILEGLKRKYGRNALSFTLNILRFPSFQSPLVLPDSLRTHFKEDLEFWLKHAVVNNLLHEHEINHAQRLIDYLDVVKTPHSDTFDMPTLLNDFKQFYTQYDQRRGKNFVDTFPVMKNWYNDIQIQQH
jgi:hypothetical protein